MARTREALQGALKISGLLMIISGGLHILAWVIGRWDGDLVLPIPFGIAYLLVGAGLYYRLPKIRYLALLVALIGALGAYIALGSTGTDWLIGLIIVIDLAVIALLVTSTWRGRRPA